MALRDLWRRGNRPASGQAQTPAGGRSAAGKGADPALILDQIQQTRRLGRLEDARQQLVAALVPGGGLTDNVELNRLYWDLCVQLERPEDGARQILRAIQGQMRSRRFDDAAFAWFELCDRLPEPPKIELDFRRRLAEAMLEAGHEEAAAELLEKSDQDHDGQTPLPVLLRLAAVATQSRSPSAPALVQATLARPGVPESQRQKLHEALEQAKARGFHPRSDAVSDVGPIEVSSTALTARQLKVIAAAPNSVDGERLRLGFPNGQEKTLALSQVQALAAVRIDEGVGDSYILVDLFLDSLWADKEELRVVRLRTRDFSPLALVPDAADEQLALGTFLTNLLASSGAHALPDAEAACGRPFHGFASVIEYQRRVLEIG